MLLCRYVACVNQALNYEQSLFFLLSSSKRGKDIASAGHGISGSTNLRGKIGTVRSPVLSVHFFYNFHSHRPTGGINTLFLFNRYVYVYPGRQEEIYF